MKTKEVDLLEVLSLIREIEDEAKVACKTLDIFSDDRNWNFRHTDQNGRIEKFDYLNLDPRILSDKGNRSTKKILENARALFYTLFEVPMNREEYEAVILKKIQNKG